MKEIQDKLTQLYSNFEAFMTEQGPEQLVVNYDNVNSFNDVLNESNITLELISDTFKNINPAGLEYLERWLVSLNDFLNLRRGLTQNIIPRLAYSIYKYHSTLTLADLKLLFDYILASKYGVFYGSVDTQTIISSFNSYSRERREFELKLIKKQEEEEKNNEFYNRRKEAVPFDPEKFPGLADLFAGKIKLLR